MVYQLKIQIQGITKPPVWRRILIPSDASFASLHEVIQAAFDWESYHLYQFSEKAYDRGWTISDDSEDDPFGMGEAHIKASETPIQEFLNPDCPKITYTYDFGDDWIHLITLENADVKDSKDPEHAHCIDGKGIPPLEDCGGVYGFMELRDYISNNPEKALKALAEEEDETFDDEEPVEGEDDNEEYLLDQVRWAGNFFDVDEKGKPEFTKIDIPLIDAVVSRIPLEIVKKNGRRKATSKRRGGPKLTDEEREARAENLLDMLGQVFGDKKLNKRDRDELKDKLKDIF